MAVLPSENAITFTSNERLYSSAVVMQTLFESRTSIINFPTATRVSPLTAREIVSWFRDEGLPIVAIADIARVERKSVYAWINGGPIRQPNQERLEKLYSLLIDKKGTDLIHLYRFWNRQLASGITLRTLLSEEHLNTQAIKTALSELWPIACRIKKITSDDQKNEGKSNPFLDEIGEVVITDDL